MYSTQHTHSLSIAFHTLLKILIAWVPLSILDSKYSKLEYRFPYSTRVWVRYRASTQRWVEYRVWLSILDSKYSKLEYNFRYSTQNTQSLSTTSHTRLKILIGWVQLSILYSSMSTVSGKYSTMSRVSSMTFHTRLNILKAWVQLSILDSKYSKLEYNFPYSTQNTQSLSTAFNTLLKTLYSTQHNREYSTCRQTAGKKAQGTGTRTYEIHRENNEGARRVCWQKYNIYGSFKWSVECINMVDASRRRRVFGSR